MRRPLRVPVFLTLGGLVWATAHWLAHRTVAAASPLGHSPGGHGSHPAETQGPDYLSTSLSLCIALAVVLAACTALTSERRAGTARSLWLFGVVPALGFLGETAAAPPSTLAGAASSLVELTPVALVVLLVQVAVSLVAVRLAHGLLDLAEALLRSLVAPLHTARRSPGDFARDGSNRSPASRHLTGAGQRAPPAPLLV